MTKEDNLDTCELPVSINEVVGFVVDFKHSVSGCKKNSVIEYFFMEVGDAYEITFEQDVTNMVARLKHWKKQPKSTKSINGSQTETCWERISLHKSMGLMTVSTFCDRKQHIIVYIHSYN